MNPELDIRINPEPEISRQAITPDRHCLVADNFLLDPAGVAAWVAHNSGRFLKQERAYPGLVLSLNDREAQPLHAFVRSRLSREFAFLRGGIEVHSQFALTTLQPQEFTWIQRLPHSDPRLAEGRANYAALLYLFEDPALGGTGFYRWRDREFFSRMTALQLDDPAAGLDVLRERFRMFREPACYTTVSNEAVELLAMVPARFNRLLCYSGDLPHSAYITAPELLSTDLPGGRLTLNCFASVWPKHT